MRLSVLNANWAASAHGNAREGQRIWEFCQGAAINAPTPDSSDVSQLTLKTLHAALLPRIQELRDYVAKSIPARLRSMISADDILQEVWILAYRALPRFEPRGPHTLDHWLRAIANTRLTEVLRNARRGRRGGDRPVTPEARARLTTFSDLLGRVYSPDKTPSRIAHANEAQHAVLIGIQRLQGARRRAIELYYIKGLSQKEVADQLGRSPAAVNSLLVQARRQLCAFLGDAGKYFTDARSAEPIKSERGEPR